MTQSVSLFDQSSTCTTNRKIYYCCTFSGTICQASMGWVIPWNETACWSCVNSVSALWQLHSQYRWSWLELLAFLQSVSVIAATHQHSYILKWVLVLLILRHLDLHALQSISVDYTLIYDDCCVASQLTLPKPVKQVVFVEERNMATIRLTAFSLHYDHSWATLCSWTFALVQCWTSMHQ